MDFNFVKLIMTIELARDALRPPSLFGIRGEFAAAFRETVACRCTTCADCPSAASCAYHQVFAQGLSPDPTAVKRFQKPPLPFVFDLPLFPMPPKRSAPIEVGLTMVGNAVNHLDSFITAFRLLLSKHGAGLEGGVLRVEMVDYAGNRSLFQEGEEAGRHDGLLLLSLGGLCRAKTLSMERLTLTTFSPLRILRDARPIARPDFSSIVRALMRRVSSMAYHYGTGDEGLDFKWLARKSGIVETVTDSFRWVDWGGGVSGVMGSGTFVGDLSEFHPFLLAGEWLHVGKGAAFGFGRFHLGEGGSSLL